MSPHRWSVALCTGAALLAAEAALGASALDELLERFESPAPAPAGSVELDAWIEPAESARELVIVLQPEGEAKLVADPGVTVTPLVQPGVEWQVPLPLRHVDPGRDYFDPPASVRLPFAAEDEQPIEVRVEYAYCIVDYQCLFGEETLSVANRID